MPATRSTKAIGVNKPKMKSKVVVGSNKTAKNIKIGQATGETSQKALLSKAKTKLTPKKSEIKSSGPASKRLKAKDTRINSGNVTSARFIEDDNFIDMEVTNVEEWFPNEEEDRKLMNLLIESSQESQVESNNNNATIRCGLKFMSSQGSPSAAVGKVPSNRGEELPHFSGTSPNHSADILTSDQDNKRLRIKLSLMEQYMVKKGVINASLTEDELIDFLSDGPPPTEVVVQESTHDKNCQGRSSLPVMPEGESNMTHHVINKPDHSLSEVTIYRKAVRQLNPELEVQIDKLLLDARRNELSSSDEFALDTSDESDKANEFPNSIADVATDNRPKAPELVLPVGPQEPEMVKQKLTTSEEANRITREVEQNKALLHGLPGKPNDLDADFSVACKVSVSQIDQDYQMIDSHIDESIKCKIHNLEYVDFSKLISKSKTTKDDEGGQRLEIVNHNGMSYLSPVTDRDTVAITSYFKWEQAFRVFSNILTSKYPLKATQLLQYNHTIHSASMAYIWDNVYAYDKEFQHHIARHPTRPWGGHTATSLDYDP